MRPGVLKDSPRTQCLVKEQIASGRVYIIKPGTWNVLQKQTGEVEAVS